MSALGLGISRVPPPLGVRCALFWWWFCDVWVVLVALMELIGLFVGFASEPASDARQRRPPATPASDARQRRLPAGHTKPPLDSKPAGYARGRSLMPPVTTTARHGCIYRETQRKRTFRCVRRRPCLAIWEFCPKKELIAEENERYEMYRGNLW